MHGHTEAARTPGQNFRPIRLEQPKKSVFRPKIGLFWPGKTGKTAFHSVSDRLNGFFEAVFEV